MNLKWKFSPISWLNGKCGQIISIYTPVGEDKTKKWGAKKEWIEYFKHYFYLVMAGLKREGGGRIVETLLGIWPNEDQNA